MKKLVTPNAIHWLDDNDILHKEIKRDAHVQIDTLKATTEKLKEFTGDKKKYVLYNAIAHFTITEEVMEYLLNYIFAERNYATAVVTNKTGVRLMVDYMVRVRKLKTPLQIFSNEKDAVKWLLKLKKQNNHAEALREANEAKNKLVTEHASHWIDEHGILHRKVTDNANAEIGAIQEAYKRVQKFAGNKKRLNLYHANVNFTLTEEVMEHLRTKIFARDSIATAVVSDTLAAKLMVDYMVNEKKLKKPMKLFHTEKAAVKWLLTFKKSKTGSKTVKK